VTERMKELVELISDLQVESVQRKDFEGFLDIAMATRLLFRALPGAEAQRRMALYSMENALSLLIPKEEPAEPIDLSTLKCSFCGRQEPEVMLGAGADGFICDECVDLFTEVFRKRREEKERDEAPN